MHELFISSHLIAGFYLKFSKKEKRKACIDHVTLLMPKVYSMTGCRCFEVGWDNSNSKYISGIEGQDP